MALLISIASAGRFIFAALGAVYVTPMVLSGYTDENAMRQAYGKISLSGPTMNLLLAIFFIFLAGQGGGVAEISYMGFRINLWLAAFNLLPFRPLDGSKVYAWSKAVWGIFTIPTWLFILFVL